MNFSWRKTPASIRTAMVAAVLGFVVSCSSTTTSSRNGRLTECSYVDGGALILGALAVITGLVGVAASWRRTDDKVLMLVLSGVSIVAGVFHVLRGVGAVGGPCN